MSIYRGNKKEKSEIGAIKYLGPCKYVNGIPVTDENHNNDIIAVFKEDMMIWPTVSKYLFWISNSDKFENIMMNDTLYINEVEPYEQAINILVRSCTRFFDSKYSIKAKCSASWISINNNECINIYNETKEDGTEHEVCEINDILILADTNKKCEEENPDINFTINISKNTSLFDRSTTIILTQVDDYHEMCPTGKFAYIVINQKADYPLNEKDDFTNSTVTWYTNETFLNTTSSYGDKNQGYINATGGDFNVFFSIDVSVGMASGIKSYRKYGTKKNETLSLSSIISSSPDKITVKSIEYNSNGGFIALLNISQNNFISGTSKPIISITDLKVYPESVNYVGGKATVSWKNYATVVSDMFVSTLSVILPNANPIGSAQLYQNGGNVRYKTNELNNEIVIPDENKSWIKLDGSINIDNDKNYSQKIIVSQQNSVSKMYIENLKTNFDTETIPYNATSAELSFDIYKREGSYIERKSKITVLSSGVSESTNIIQNGKDGEYPVLITDKELNSTTIHIKENNPENNEFYSSIFKDFKNIRYYRYAWRVDALINANLSQSIEKGIYIEGYDNPIPENEHYEYVYFTIKSGVGNSQERHSILSISIPEYYCEYKEEFEQDGSNTTENIKYYDDLKPTLMNVNDNIEGNVAIDKSTHIYTGKVQVKENKAMDEDSLAYVVPDKVYEEYVGYVDNMNNSNIYFRVSGSPYYKGKSRNVEYEISCDGLNTKKVSATQKMNVSVKGDKSIPCIGLDENYFKLTDDSQGYINGKPQLLSSEIGLYTIPVHIEENTTATYTKKFIRMEDIFPSKEYISSQSVTLPDFYGSLLSSINCGWSKYGIPVSKTIKLVVKDIKTVECVWNNIHYSGELHTHTTPKEDYKLTVKNGIEWIALPTSNTIKFLHNTTGARRIGKLQADFYDNSEKFDDMHLEIVQDFSQKIGQYKFYTNIDINEWYEIDEQSTFSFTIFSYDTYDNKEMKVVENYDEDSILMTKSSTGNGIITYIIKSKTNSENVKKLPITFTQYNRENNKIVGNMTINFYLSCYELTLTTDKHELTINDNQNTSHTIVKSIKNIIKNGNIQEMKVPFSIYSYNYDWLSISNDDINIIVKCISMNEETYKRTAIINIEQSISGKKEYINISEDSWRDPKYDSSRIDFYNTNNPVIKKFYSMVNDLQSTPNVRFLSGSDKNLINASLSQDGDQWMLTMNPSKDINGEIYQYGYYEVYNNYRSLGTNMIYVHAYIFSTDSESNEEIVWYVSKNSNEVYREYCVASKEDGKYIDFEISNYSSSLSIKKSNNILLVSCMVDNNTGNDIVGKEITLKQNNSERIINVKIVQLG